MLKANKNTPCQYVTRALAPIHVRILDFKLSQIMIFKVTGYFDCTLRVLTDAWFCVSESPFFFTRQVIVFVNINTVDCCWNVLWEELGHQLHIRDARKGMVSLSFPLGHFHTFTTNLIKLFMVRVLLKVNCTWTK